MEGNEASKRVLEKCGFKQANPERFCTPPTSKTLRTFRERGEDKSLEEVDEQKSECELGIEVDGVMHDIYGNRLLTETETEELKNAIEGMKVQTKPAIEPRRMSAEDSAPVVPRPMKKRKLIGYRYERKLTMDELLHVLDGGEYF
jgi:hypothetical protein